MCPADDAVQTNVLHTVEVVFDASLADVDLRRFQAAFSDLFDRAAEAIQRLGLDNDDIVLDRILVCRTPDGVCEIPADWISDKARLIVGIQNRLEAHNRRPDSASRVAFQAAHVHILALKVMVRSEPLPTREFPIS